MEPAPDSMLLRYLGGDVRRWRAWHAERAAALRREHRQLAALVAADDLAERRRRAAEHPEPIKVIVEPMLPADQLLIAARQLAASPAFLDALGDALLQNETLFRPLVEYLAKKPKKKPAAGPAAGDVATPEQPDTKD